jgi:hypothetical protein
MGQNAKTRVPEERDVDSDVDLIELVRYSRAGGYTGGDIKSGPKITRKSIGM